MTEPSDVVAMSQHPLHAVWCAGGDASNSPDFRDPDGVLDEECDELIAATEQGDVVGIADACADLVYVAYGTAFTYGIPLDRVLAEVHRSNMMKDPGPTGKAVKGGRYSPPDVAGVLAERSTKEML
jgi:predicted HAD superfamily Cof-like phosphohydrolase